MHFIGRLKDWELARYILISFFGYGFVFGLMYLLVNLIKEDPKVAFLVTYLLAYVLDYLVNLFVVFNKNHTNDKAIKYLGYLIVFYIVSNLLYRFIIDLGVNHLISVFLTMSLLFPLKFLSSKFIVFK